MARDRRTAGTPRAPARGSPRRACRRGSHPSGASGAGLSPAPPLYWPAALLLGRAGDLYGRRRPFMAGLALFAASSLVGGLTWEPWILVFARFVQGARRRSCRPRSRYLPPPSRRERSATAHRRLRRYG